jgi:3-dehydroquinate synthase
MKELVVQTSSKEYPVIVGSKALHRLPAFLLEKKAGLTKLFIITDETVASHYLSELLQTLSTFQVEYFIVPSGEKAKTFDVYYDCMTAALNSKLDRHSVVLAFGGGAVGDLAGFVAATFMRGIPFIQLPTTILAHDSAVGGKVAINHPAGKNMVGAFYQPEVVIYDIDLLQSLPKHERRSGFAEVIKHGLIQDQHFYIWLKENILTLDTISPALLEIFLARGIEIKAAIVAEDEKETGIRAYLNFGHTLGHAIEAEMGYGEMTHGEAVVIGMIFALELSKKYRGLDFDIKVLREWLHLLGYTTRLPEHLSHERLIDRMKSDKKSVGQRIRMVLLESIGQPTLIEIAEEDVLHELREFSKEVR